MRLSSWNVNGLRAAADKGFFKWLAECGSDVVGIQETKLHQGLEHAYADIPGFASYWSSTQAQRGYSGVGVYSKIPPLSVIRELPDAAFCEEGRLIGLEFPNFYFFNVYFPNGQMSEERLAYKLGFYEAFLAFCQQLRQTKPIVACGDYNTAHKPIDLRHPKANENTSGFLPVERAFLDKYVAHGYLDTFRLFDKNPDRYTWWSYRAGARPKNVGWRIDYFFVSEELKTRVVNAWIDDTVMGSDHCPIGIELRD